MVRRGGHRAVDKQLPRRFDERSPKWNVIMDIMAWEQIVAIQFKSNDSYLLLCYYHFHIKVTSIDLFLILVFIEKKLLSHQINAHILMGVTTT